MRGEVRRVRRQVDLELLALGAVGLLHAASKSEDKAKVVRCFSIALVLLVAAWAVNATWGPEWFKTNFVKLPAAVAK